MEIIDPVDNIDELIKYAGDDRVVHINDYFSNKAKNTDVKRIYTQRLRELDNMTDGFETGELITITGPTGNGKTLLANTISDCFMAQGMGVAWFTYEVSPAKLFEKYRHGTNIPLYLPMELKAADFNWLVKKAHEAQLKYFCSAIIIDHLHFLVDMNTRLNMSLNIGAVVRHLKKTVANDMNMLVVLLAHQTQGNDDKEPGLNSIRDSSFIGQESDTVFTVYRKADTIDGEENKRADKTYDQGMAIVKIDKARRAGTYRKKIILQKKGEYLEESL
jgi:replicative DNA helicase